MCLSAELTESEILNMQEYNQGLPLGHEPSQDTVPHKKARHRRHGYHASSKLIPKPEKRVNVDPSQQLCAPLLWMELGTGQNHRTLVLLLINIDDNVIMKELVLS